MLLRGYTPCWYKHVHFAPFFCEFKTKVSDLSEIEGFVLGLPSYITVRLYTHVILGSLISLDWCCRRVLCMRGQFSFVNVVSGVCAQEYRYIVCDDL